jgi:hypothetical protein
MSRLWADALYRRRAEDRSGSNEVDICLAATITVFLCRLMDLEQSDRLACVTVSPSLC